MHKATHVAGRLNYKKKKNPEVQYTFCNSAPYMTQGWLPQIDNPLNVLVKKKNTQNKNKTLILEITHCRR